MRRRQFLAAGAALLGTRYASAQTTGRPRRVGILTGAGARGDAPFYIALEARLRELGYVDGKNLALEWHSGAGDAQAMANAAAAMARTSPEVVIATGSEVLVRAARQAVGATPIVMVAVNFDPVEKNFVASLARPGGNITGLFFREVETAAKRLELLKEAHSGASRVCVLFDELSRDQFRAAEAVAAGLGLTLLPHEMRGSPYDFQGPLEAAARQKAHAVLALTSARFFPVREKMIGAAIRHGLPVVANPNYAEAGALLSYGTDFSAMFRRAVDYVDRILKGAKPADLPVEQPTKYEMVVNLKTAKALGIKLPQSIVVRANRLIE
jgi:putative ABC transport system substrate-binding protein